MNPEEALRRTGAQLQGARILRRLHAGALKSVWLLGRGAERWVMRVDEPQAAGFVPDRGQEYEVQAAAAALGLAPQPVCLVPGPPAVLVSAWVAGRSWELEDAVAPGRIERLAGLLHRLHAAALPGPELDLEQLLGTHARRLGTQDAVALSRSARQWLLQATAAQASVLCHNDPILPNVVGLRQTLLIDWEYAARGDPLFDLAVLAQHHALPAALVERLVRAYFGETGQPPWQRFEAWCRLYDHLLCLWLMDLQRLGPLPSGQQQQLATARQRLQLAA